MIRNYFMVAIRNLLKQRAYSVINITGLGIGIACFIIIFLYVFDELSYDRHHTKSDRIYRVVTKMDMNGVGENSSSCAFPFALALQREFPEAIESTVRFFNLQASRHLIGTDRIKSYEKHFFFVDSTVFNVFDIPLLQGNQSSLDRPGSVILSESMARKYFSDANPIGRTLHFNVKSPLTVTGVFRDVPAQAHFRFDFLVSMSSLKRTGSKYMENWVWNPCWTYILLKDGCDEKYISERFPGFIQKYFGVSKNISMSASLQPLTDIHLHSDMDYEIEPNGNIKYIYILGAIGIFILVIACINFMNLTTARSANRAREIGMRKTLGALRSRIIAQFVLESVIMSFFSLLLALSLVELALPLFNDFAVKELSLRNTIGSEGVLLLLLFGLLLGILSGIYPAYYLSSFKPVVVLKGVFKPGLRSRKLRQALVIVQFILAVALITCTIVMHLQLRFISRKDLGFHKDDIVLLHVDKTPAAWHFDSLKQEMLKSSYIRSITGIEDVLGVNHNTHEFMPEGYLDNQWYFFPTLVVRDDFFETFEIPLVAGRGFLKDSMNDKYKGVVINEAMARYLGWSTNSEALGRQFRSFYGQEKIIGVVRDFHATSLYSEIKPFVFNMKEKPDEISYYTRYLVARIDPEHRDEALGFMRSVWEAFKFKYPFETTFLKDELDAQYITDRKLGMLSVIFSLLAIIIASLGLTGLTSYMIESRLKEISIRKVLGSTSPGIVYLLIRSFARLILIAGFAAVPLSLFILYNWFGHYAFHVVIPWWSFVLALVTVLIIALTTVIVQAWQASRPDITEALRTNG